MDNGRLTDHHGKTVDFRNVILIMTTNAGASDMAKEGIGFGTNISKEDASEEAVKTLFSPEFRNRLDAIVPFAYLPTEVVSRVVEKFILQLEMQLEDQNVHISLDDEAKAWLTERGYDRLYGARPMGPPDPGEAETAACRGAFVRQAGAWRRGERTDQGRRTRFRDHVRPA